MYKKRFSAVCLILLLTIGGTASAQSADWWWVGGFDGNSWNEPNNWNDPNGEATVPNATSVVYNDALDGHVVVDSNVPDAACASLRIGRGWRVIGGPCYLDVTGGLLTVVEHLRLGNFFDDGTQQEVQEGVMTVSGGTIEVGGDLWLGWGGGIGVVDINGGVINLGRTLRLPFDWGCTGALYLRGGTINAVDFDSFPVATKQMHITEGKLVLDGNKADKMNEFLLEETWITAYDTRGKVVIDYNDVDDKTTVSAVNDPNIAYNPSAVGMGLPWTTNTLSWSAGDMATSHRVYFGSDADHPVEIYSGTDTTCGISTLDLSQRCYWRVDEVNGETVWTGNTWCFSTEEYLVVDDFDSYADTTSLRTVWNDGWINGTGSEVTVETETVRSGQAMRYSYTNDGTYYPYYYSEIEAAASKLEIGTDWTLGNAKALVLFFRGEPDNDDAGMYLTLTDTYDESHTVKYDSNDLSQESWEDWQMWNVNLEAISDADVNLALISKVAIVIGETDATTGGTGTLYFDDFRLYPRRCVPEYTDGDIDGDCYVDGSDLDLFSHDWLASEGNVPTVDPGTDGLLVWYNFNEGAGDVALDWADYDANNYDATPYTDRYKYREMDIKWRIGEGPDGSNCVYFDGKYCLDVPAGLFAHVDDVITISFWMNGDVGDQGNAAIFEGFTYGYAWYEIRCPSSDGTVSFYTGTSYLVWGGSAPADWEGQWNHYVFAINAAEGTRSIYHNGRLVAFGWTSDPAAGMENGWITIAAYWEGIKGKYIGLMDDFRIYNRVLSDAELGYLAGKSEIYLQPQADLFSDGKVDFKDYSMLANSWLEQELWP